jgi:hypothetical protein
MGSPSTGENALGNFPERAGQSGCPHFLERAHGKATRTLVHRPCPRNDRYPFSERIRTFDLFAIVKQIVDAKAQFRSLAEPRADTGTSTGRLMIAVLGGLRKRSLRTAG